MMTSQGSAISRLKRSLDQGQLFMAEIAARELPRVPLVEAVRICVLMAAEDDHRCERAAARWLGRFIEEGRTVGLEDRRMALEAFQAMPDQIAKEALVSLLARHGHVLRI